MGAQFPADLDPLAQEATLAQTVTKLTSILGELQSLLAKTPGADVSQLVDSGSVSAAGEPGTVVTVGTTSGTLVAANANRNYLLIQPVATDASTDGAYITVRFGAGTAVLDAGMPLFVGYDAWELPETGKRFTGAVQAVGSEAGLQIVVVEF